MAEEAPSRADETDMTPEQIALQESFEAPARRKSLGLTEMRESDEDLG